MNEYNRYYPKLQEFGVMIQRIRWKHGSVIWVHAVRVQLVYGVAGPSGRNVQLAVDQE